MNARYGCLILIAILFLGCTTPNTNNIGGPENQQVLTTDQTAVLPESIPPAIDNDTQENEIPMQNDVTKDSISNQTSSQNTILTELSMAEVSKHNAAQNCWVVVYGKVLDLTAFTAHPGGSAYVPYCGTEATRAFETKGGQGSGHSQAAVSWLDSYTIGALGSTVNSTALPATNQTIPKGEDEDDEYEDEFEDD